MVEVTMFNVEHLLDAGLLKAQMRDGAWWAIRRNGRTQRWKREPGRFKIPIKAGLRSHAYLTEADFVNGVIKPDLFRHTDDVSIIKRRRA